MSKTRTPIQDELGPIRYDEEVREDLEELAEREDLRLGAIARVFLALADGERPSKVDCREAGLLSVWDAYEDGGLR